MKRYILKNSKEVEEFLVDFNKEKFAFDTETTSLRYDEQDLICVTLCDGNKSGFILADTEQIPYLKYLFSNNKTAIGHNIVFDAKAVYKKGISMSHSLWFDTMVLHHLLDENDDKGLKYLAKKFLNRTMGEYDSKFLSISIPRINDYFNGEKDSLVEKFINYAIDDAEATWDLSRILKNIVSQEPEIAKLFMTIEMPFLHCIFEMEVNGILIDQKQVEITTRKLKNEINELQFKMLGLLGERYSIQANLLDEEITIISPINFSSSAQLQDILVNKLGLEVSEKTKKGNTSVGKLTINRLKNTNEFVSTLEKFKIATKLLNAFFIPLPTLLDNQKRIHPHYNNTGTVTGRLSCNNPNIQQLPKVNKQFPIDTRMCFIAPQGKKLVAIDFSQQELRIMAHLSKDETLIDLINNKGDAHLINANTVFGLGIPKEMLYETHPEFEETKEKYKNYRDKGKIFTFGIAYGMGEHKLSRDFGISIEEAKILLNNFFSGFPRLEEAIKLCHTQANLNLYVTTLTGRRRRFERNPCGKVDDKGLRQSFNFLIQGLGADIMRLSCIGVLEYQKEHPEMEIKLIMSVHDELVFEVKEKYAKQAEEEIRKMMQLCYQLVVPLTCNGKIGNTYSEVK